MDRKLISLYVEDVVRTLSLLMRVIKWFLFILISKKLSQRNVRRIHKSCIELY